MSPDPGLIVRYVGHSSFLLRSPSGVRLLIDPYDNPTDDEDPWFARPIGQIQAELLAMTHGHFDHDAVHRVVVIEEGMRGRGTMELGDMRVQGFRDRHAGEEPLPNLVLLVEAGTTRFCHLGDNRGDIDLEIVKACDPVDVLAVPVDDTCHLLSFPEVGRLIAAFDPRVVVPVHYRHPDISADTSPLGGCDGWLATQPTVRMMEGEIDAGRSGLPSEREVWVLGPIPGPSTGPGAI